MTIYLDNNATTRVAQEILEEALPYFHKMWGNPSSPNNQGLIAHKATSKARQQVANLINCDPEQIIFTSGATESNNIALIGHALSMGRKSGNIIIPKFEHPSVLETSKRLSSLGFKVQYLNITPDGVIDLNELKSLISQHQTNFISVMHANNETGVIQPLSEIREILNGNDIFFHTDAAQTVGKLSIDVQKLGLDSLSLSGHKIHSFKGVGALFIKNPNKILPIIYGGSQEYGIRPGTLNVPGIVALGKACEIASQGFFDYSKTKQLRDYLEKEILRRLKNLAVSGVNSERLPTTSNICFFYTEGDAIVANLNKNKIEVSTGSACSSQNFNHSHVLKAMGLPPEVTIGSVRISLAYDTSEKEIKRTIEQIENSVNLCREISPIYLDLIKKKKVNT